MKQWNSKNAFKLLLDFVGIAVGAVIAAFAIEEFLVPCTILDGGVVGIGIIVNYLTGWPLGILTVVLNTPFLLIGSRKMGRMFIVKAVYAMVIFSVFLEIFAPMQNVTSENLLAVSFGGVVLIFSAVGIIMGLDRAMYSLLTYFITSKVLDIVESGLEKTKAAMIITDDAQEIAGQIYSRLGRTVTIMEGAGLVSGKKVVLYCVLTRFEIHELKEIIKNIDASAFIAISDVSEIIGTHVKKAGRIPQEVAAKLQENSPPVPPPTEE